MRKNTDKFLDLYREYETLLRSQGRDYRQAEDGADEVTAGRLRINRQLRNYLVHNADPSFIEISDEQISFVSHLISIAASTEDTLQQHMKTLKSASCHRSDHASSALAKMVRHHAVWLPIFEDDGTVKAISVFDVARVIANKSQQKNSPTLADVKAVSRKVCFLDQNTKMDEISKMCSPIVCVTARCPTKGKHSQATPTDIVGIYLTTDIK